jgi:hypothetical protein
MRRDDLPESVHAWLPRDVAERLLSAGRARIDPKSGVMYVSAAAFDEQTPASAAASAPIRPSDPAGGETARFTTEEPR